MDVELKLYTLMSGLLLKMIDDVPQDAMQEQMGDGNPPSWILGHLALANDFGVISLGGNAGLVGPWMQVFGPGSPPVGEHPSKRELVSMFSKSRKRLLSEVKSATDEQLHAERNSPLLKAELPQVQDMVAHLMTTHLALHIGQLSAWRRAKGMESILQV